MEKKEYVSAEMQIVAINTDILTASEYADPPQATHDYFTGAEEM